MFYNEIYKQTGPESAFFKHLEAQSLKILLLGANHSDAFVGFDVWYQPAKKL